MKQILSLLIVMGFLFLNSCNSGNKENSAEKEVKTKEGHISESDYDPKPGDLVISREDYKDRLYGFWLGQCIANWTGLITEMDKIGNIGDIKTGNFYTRKDWGQPDQPSIWGEGIPSQLSPTIDFILIGEDSVWGADDDTDIEYMYQHLIHSNKAPVLNAEQIRDGWLKHIKAEEENFLWVSNQTAFDLMKEGVLPPETSSPENNENYMMIDAQLTTEIFGLFAPARPDVALRMSALPIRVTAREDAAWISEFYVIMYSLASATDPELEIKDQINWMANEARKRLPENSYSAKMFDFVQSKYQEGSTWEEARDALYQRYQVEEKDGYDLTSRNLYCNGCFAAGINFAASIVSLFYGEGDLVETIKIGALCGWDSDNPTATWGGLLGFIIGKEGIEKAFDQKFSNKFNIHRTRQNFPDNGLDTFENMAETGASIVDQVVTEEMQGAVDLDKNVWYIPLSGKEQFIKQAIN
ncbi:ADP-ribosylglycohydrolase family protein [Lutimonas zeaxanthinifaciens]|uniref:ADP-ribosylglycohydrolase family protein n=1 Tax=Lutimonas zeaxanthinifaciens TaxID=3060215 RepID=UPI00265D29B7|nr:ADP-ribosylglycohydrolase family protein [Lutimonas sp. YSD2104]WKK66046.1 ADP-ribosylglycohydrolase family protein [Lutimonas sp. YSD2104]